MINTKQYIPDDNRSWIEEYINKMGEKELIEYYNKVFIRLYDMKPLEQIDMNQEVNPNNYDLFVKCVVTCFDELANYGICDYHIEDNLIIKM